MNRPTSSMNRPTDIFSLFLLNSLQFNWKIFQVLSSAYSVYLDTLLFEAEGKKSLGELEKSVKNETHRFFDTRLRSDDFVKTLTDYVTNCSDFAHITGFGNVYQYLSTLSSLWNNYFIELIRDAFWRTPSEKIGQLEKYSLFVYKKSKAADIDNRIYPKTPLLIVYAFINIHYILDLLPEISVVRNLLRNGFDIYATDWGTPAAYDKDLTINHFVNTYMDKSIDLIRKRTNSDKVSLLGYCWGGNLALAYAALHPEKVKNLIAVATPGDSKLDDTLLSIWTKSTNVENLLNAFGNFPGILLAAALILRDPIEYIHKYPHFFEKPHDFDSIMEFFATEAWLHDTKPIIGEIYREFVQSCYQQNLFIKNEMKIDRKLINLKEVNMPFLNVIAQKDDLVSPGSSTALNNAVGSTDKNLIEFQSGHVGLITGQRAHKEVWPKVGAWLNERS